MGIRRFEDIEAWQLARELTRKVYGATKTGSFAKDFSLKDQIRAAAGSVMHNIAEGFDAGTHPEFARFLGYAQRSCTEVQSELYVAQDQEHITVSEFHDIYEHSAKTRAKIGAFIKYLKSA